MHVVFEIDERVRIVRCARYDSRKNPTAGTGGVSQYNGSFQCEERSDAFDHEIDVPRRFDCGSIVCTVPVPMSITERIRTRFTSKPSYACGYCGLTFDHDRLNCPACGCDVHEVQ